MDNLIVIIIGIAALTICSVIVGVALSERKIRRIMDDKQDDGK
jgi:hypothetical protein